MATLTPQPYGIVMPCEGASTSSLHRSASRRQSWQRTSIGSVTGNGRRSSRTCHPHLPAVRRGARRVDDRRVISGIVHMLRTGARWRDCPAEYGPYTTVYNRFNRWSKQGVWEDVFYVLSGTSGGVGTTSVDSTSIKAQRSASGGKGGSVRRQSDDLAAAGRPRFMP